MIVAPTVFSKVVFRPGVDWSPRCVSISYVLFHSRFPLYLANSFLNTSCHRVLSELSLKSISYNLVHLLLHPFFASLYCSFLGKNWLTSPRTGIYVGCRGTFDLFLLRFCQILASTESFFFENLVLDSQLPMFVPILNFAARRLEGSYWFVLYNTHVS